MLPNISAMMWVSVTRNFIATIISLLVGILIKQKRMLRKVIKKPARTYQKIVKPAVEVVVECLK